MTTRLPLRWLAPSTVLAVLSLAVPAGGNGQSAPAEEPAPAATAAPTVRGEAAEEGSGLLAADPAAVQYVRDLSLAGARAPARGSGSPPRVRRRRAGGLPEGGG